jgi:catechol 2,3-dioxygenase-like lactoylglutathione lyase family enzyme
MTPAVQEMVAATYVRDIDVSRGFYELLGFAEDSTGQAATSGWSALQQGGYMILLASTKPPLDLPQLPLLFYFFFDDVDVVIDRLRAGGVEVAHMGYPPHALGGEAKVADPDGNTVLLGQRERSASQQQPHPADDSVQHFSLLHEAAALVSARGGAKTRCQVNGLGPKPCRQEADVKLADAAGDSVWTCLDHADEILVTVRGAFIASQADEGLASYLAHRRK